MQELRHARPQLSLQLVAFSPLLVLQRGRAHHWVRMQELRHARPQLSLQLVALSPLLVLQPAGNEEEENDAEADQEADLL